MRNLDFKYTGAWNFLPFGSEGIEFDFKKYGNIVLIQGENRDSKAIELNENQDSSDYKISGNGVGKSSVFEIVVWTLYGKTIKRPEKIQIDDVIHNKIKTDCKTIVHFDKYKIQRTRTKSGKSKHSTLRIWESEQGVWDDSTEITQGEMRQTQKKIEDIVGLSYDAFINICIFTDDQRSCFLECDKDTKLEIVENLMSLSIYREWFENAKLLRKEAKANIDLKSKEYSLLLNNKDDAIRRMDLTKKKQIDWYKTKEQELVNINTKISTKNALLGKTDNGSAILVYQQAQEKIATINNKTPELELNKTKIEKWLELSKEKDDKFREEARIITESANIFSNNAKISLEERKKKESKIISLSSKVPDTRCDSCYNLIQSEDIESYATTLNKEIAVLNSEITNSLNKAKEFTPKIDEIKANQVKQRQLASQAEEKLKAINNQLRTFSYELTAASQVREPKADSSELLLQQQIEELNRQLVEKQLELKNPSPFDEILQNDEFELDKISKLVNKKEKEVKDLEADLPYFDYWINGFGANGIRKWIIDGIIPDLNARVNYWLQFLIDNMITVKFDNELKETIERNPPDGDPYLYFVMSTGQRRRLNLAIGHSFAYITELSSEAIPSFIFLDEVSTNVDILGCIGIYNMICELAENKQVFVTTHDQDLTRMLQGVSTIRLVHENGFTKKID